MTKTSPLNSLGSEKSETAQRVFSLWVSLWLLVFAKVGFVVKVMRLGCFCETFAKPGGKMNLNRVFRHDLEFGYQWVLL